MSLSKEQVLMEYVKCHKDTTYALRTYLQTYDNTVSKYVPLELFPDQISLLEDYENYNENIALKYRQAGVTTVTAAWASKKLVLAQKSKPENPALHPKPVFNMIESWIPPTLRSSFWPNARGNGCPASLTTIWPEAAWRR